MLDRRSLPAQMILSFIGVVILTVAATGIPAILLFHGQFARQAWSQVEQGQRAAEALYAARQNEVAGLATLTALIPSLPDFLEQNDPSELSAYLRTILASASIDFFIVCNSSQSMIASAGEILSADICRYQENEGFYLAPGELTPDIWLVGAHPIASGAEILGKVVAGVKLDQAFISQMHTLTGLDHTLWLDGRPILTSFEAGIRQLESIPPQSAFPEILNRLFCSWFEYNCLPYYAARFPLKGEELIAEVALEIGDIGATQRRLNWINSGSMFAVMALCSVLGIFLANRISRPLVDLAASADRFSQGDLNSPVVVATGVREELLVAQALERARIDLQRTLTDLQREKAWINQLLESIVEGIVTLDGQLHITFFSHGAEKITGWARDQVLDRFCDEIFHLAETETPFSSLIPAPGQSVKVLVNLANQSRATLSLTGARLAPTEAGETQVVFVFRDVSEEESTHRLLGYFIANVAHEFRTPLSSLAASIELLLDQTSSLSSDELEELLKSLHLGILNLQTLVDNLLEGASIEAGHFRVSPRSYELDAILAEAINTMQPLLEKYGQRITVELPAEMPVVRADPRRTVQVLVNLLSNASRYGPSDADISVSVSTAGDLVRVSVADCGPGIPTEYRNEVFRRFIYPGVGSQTKVGAGLGLSVVKAVVEAQGGQVGVEDRPSGGSVFWFSLPVTDES
jgi:PAS domain S-box-containing protein